MTGIISKPVRKSKQSQRIFLPDRWDELSTNGPWDSKKGLSPKAAFRARRFLKKISIRNEHFDRAVFVYGNEKRAFDFCCIPNVQVSATA
jgi:hypothetical protein